MHNSLLHFTGRKKTPEQAFDALTNICNTLTLRLSYCPAFAKEKFEQKFMMACLTDPNLISLANHSVEFGKFAIGLKKESMMEYGANPVFYVTSGLYKNIESQFSLLSRFEDLNKDRDWKEMFEPYKFSEAEYFSFHLVCGLSQEFAYKSIMKRQNYTQSEWRMLYRPHLFVGHTQEHSPGTIFPGHINGRNIGLLKIKKEDIDFIITPQDFEEKGKSLCDTLQIQHKVFENQASG